MNTPEEVEVLKRALAIPGVEENILKRWSPGAFAEREVSAENLKKLFEAARWAASCFNEQPWRFLVGRKGDPTYRRIYDSLVEFNQAWAKSSPVLIVSAGKTVFSGNGKENRYALHDTGAATAYLALQATALGLHTHSMGGFDREKIRAAFDIPAEYEIGAVTAAGYLGDVDALAVSMKDRELAPRERRPLKELVFSEWGRVYKFDET